MVTPARVCELEVTLADTLQGIAASANHVRPQSGLPPLPEALDSNEIQVVVPINYKLKKTT